MDDKKTLAFYTDGFLGMVTSTISFINPALGIAAMAVSPAVSMVIKEWLFKLVDNGSITQREFSRLNEGLEGIIDTLKDKSSTQTIRKDSLLKTNENGFCDADDIFESMLNQIKIDSEKKKAYFYGNFVGSIPYASDLNYSNLMQYCHIIGKLSFSEICLLHNFYKYHRDKSVDFGKAELQVKRGEDPDASEILADILHLLNLGLLIKRAPYNSGELIGKVSLSFSGIRLYSLMRLHLLDIKDTNKTLRVLWSMTKG